jgi:cholesterol oxidase
MTMRQTEYDVVIVGSGFGGSISALRLAQAGKSVAVLERGRRWLAGQFPRDTTDVNTVFWRWPGKSAARGLYELRFFSGVSAVVASGVGGGSLVYANIHIRPDADVFADERWPRTVNRASLDPYYDRVAAALGISPVPTATPIPKRDALHAAALSLGKPVFDADQAVNWDKCKRCSQCEFGCQHGAKNTLDLTYLAEAEKLGAEVLPGLAVTSIEPAGNGYRVHYRDVATGVAGSVVGARVVVAAGTIGTNELLLRCRDIQRTLPKLSPRLGEGYSANGDFLGNIENSGQNLHPWDGPDVTTVLRYAKTNGANGANGASADGAPPFTLAAPGFTRGVTSVLASLGQPHLEWVRFLAPFLRSSLNGVIPWMFGRGMLAKPLFLPEPNAGDPARMINLFAIGRDNANGRFRMNGGGTLDIEWDYANENRALIDAMTTAMNDVARSLGGTFAPLALWSAFERLLTVHSLGGCRLGESAAKGVVSEHGEVFGYPGLFVADGSVIPTAIGFHPVMTIAAVCERIAERIAAS